ncbi:MAG TPA: hypothetical protein VMV43_04440 [Candidatus Nanopelagicaceae bacterium]|nr:hypothetical protein [Candidatus Nanopelagicaceae bacterium]
MEKEELKISVSKNQNGQINLENSCCGSSNSCCEGSTSKESSTTHDINLKETVNIDPNKLSVDIYVPLNACECVWSQFMNLVFSALAPYMKYIRFETKDLDSEEARKLNLTGNCVIVDGKKKFITSFALKKELPELLKEKGLL